MGKIRWELSAVAVLLFALVYFFDNEGLVAAMLPAIAIHELGHAAALRLCGARLRQVRIGIFGVEMDYSGALDLPETLLSVGAGPAAGLVYAFAAGGLGGEYFRFSGAASLFLSAFNLLPILPLDGGRIAEALAGRETAETLSLIGAAVLFLSGIALLALNRVAAPAAMGLWLLSFHLRGRKKKKEIPLNLLTK